MKPGNQSVLNCVICSILMAFHVLLWELVFHKAAEIFIHFETFFSLLKALIWLFCISFFWIVMTRRSNFIWRQALIACFALVITDLLLWAGWELITKGTDIYITWTYWWLGKFLTPLIAIGFNVALLSDVGKIKKGIGNVAPIRRIPWALKHSLNCYRSLSIVSIVVLGVLAVALINFWILPQLPVNPWTLTIAYHCRVRSESDEDFDFLLRNYDWRELKLKALLDHLELARLQRGQFYSELSQDIYRQYILSPELTHLPIREYSWRRDLWETYFPRIRGAGSLRKAAFIIVNELRQRVTIDGSFHASVGIETIWCQRRTDMSGFARIYAAALRSVGIAARIRRMQVELWTGIEWQLAPEPIFGQLIK